MFMVEIAGMRALYTGDYSRLADRHMPAADLPSPPPHVGTDYDLQEHHMYLYAISATLIPHPSMLFDVALLCMHSSILVDEVGNGHAMML